MAVIQAWRTECVTGCVPIVIALDSIRNGQPPTPIPIQIFKDLLRFIALQDVTSFIRFSSSATHSNCDVAISGRFGSAASPALPLTLEPLKSKGLDPVNIL
jgi:hypothetical protein